MKQIHATIRGRVQGVGFRLFTRDLADSLGIRGWVRNNPDGSVETVATGDGERLRQFLDGLHRGPSGSRVDDFTHRASDQDSGLMEFRIVG